MVQDAIAQRVIDRPDGGLAAREVNLALEDAALRDQFLQDRQRILHIAVHRALGPGLLEQRAARQQVRRVSNEQDPEAKGHCRGRGNAGTARVPPEATMQRGARLSFQ